MDKRQGWRAGLRLQLLALVLLAVLPPVALVLDAQAAARIEAVAREVDALAHMADLATSALDAKVQGVSELLALLSRLPVVRAGDANLLCPLLAEMLVALPDYANMGLVDDGGQLRASGVPSVPVDLSSRAWFRRALDGDGLVVGDHQIGVVTGESSINFAQSVRGADGTRLGVVYAALRLPPLQRLVDVMALPAGSVLTITDAAGTLLARHPAPEAGSAPTLRLPDVVPVGELEPAEAAGPDGVAHLFAQRSAARLHEGGLRVVLSRPAGEVRARAEAPYRRALLGLLGVATLALAAAWLAAEMLLVRRVRALTAAAGVLAEGRHAGRTGLEHDRDEIGQLARAFDTLAAALEFRALRQAEAQERAGLLASTLELRVQQRTAALRDANAELEAFAYSVSHDLRAPVRHIDGYAALLQRHAAEHLDERGRHDLRAIRESATRMNRLIDDMLLLSRVGRAELRRVPVDLGALVRDAWDELAPERSGRELQFEVGPLPIVRGDPQLLRQALGNLLSNALKYSRERRPARIRVTGRVRPGARVELSVSDNGVGFDMQHAGRLFGAFQRLHDATRFEGNGIGLAIVRRIVERHAGRVRAEARLDAGATFHIELPLEDPA